MAAAQQVVIETQGRERPLTDAELARRFERGEIRSQDFHHLEHLRVAWTYLHEGSPEEACVRLCDAIRAFAAACGRAEKYHQTMTVFWVLLLSAIRTQEKDAQELEAILPQHPYLLDKNTPLRHYSRDCLFSDNARLRWQPPDVRPLEFHASHADSCASPSDTPGRSVPR